LLAPRASEAQGPIRLTVADAIARGFEASHRIAEARAREDGAKAAATSAALNDKPNVNVSGGYTRTNHVDEFGVRQPNGTILVVYPDIPNNYYSRAGFNWPIFTSGRMEALEQAAQAEAKAAGVDIDTARADLRLEIVRAYWAAATGREAVRVLEESAARAEAQLTDARHRFDVGLIPPNEVTSLEAQRSRERAQLIEAENIRESALIDLRRLIGVPYDTVIELADSLEMTTTAPSQGEVALLAKQALDSRPERQAMTLRLGGAESRVKAAAAATRPTVSFAGGFDY
jgi:outer membrane protein